MKQNRTQNAVRGIGAGLINNVLTILLPFMTRTVIIYKLGMEYAGLNNLFGAIINILNISELGIGSAISYSMYRPLQEGDDEKVRALLALYKKCYRFIGFVTLLVGIGFIPFLEYLVAGDYPESINLYVLYIIYLANNVLGYFLFAYKKVILSANQRYDVEVSITTVCTILQNVLQIVLLLFIQSYYVYVIVIPLITLLSNIFNSMMVNKMFPQFYCCGTVEKEQLKHIGKSVAGILCTKISSTVFLSVDSIIVSAFLGLTILGVYGNYYYVVTCLIAVFAVIHNSIRPVVGNCLITDTREKLFDNFQTYQLLYMWFAAWASTCMACMYQTFEFLWGGPNNILPLPIVFLLVVCFYLGRMGALQEVYLEASGLYWERRFVPLTAAALNLIVNIVLVQKVGLVGVIVSTIVSYLIVTIPCNLYMIKKYCFKEILCLSHFYGRLVIQIIVWGICCIVTYSVCSLFGERSVFDLIKRGIVCVFLPNIIYILCFIRDGRMKKGLELIKNVLIKKSKRN